MPWNCQNALELSENMKKLTKGLIIVLPFLVGGIVVILQETTQKTNGDKPSDTVEEIEVTVTQINHAESIVGDEALQSEIVQNTGFVQAEMQESEAAPTFDEALEMEVVVVGSPQSELRRRVSSRVSMRSDELPDYENYESHPVFSN